MNNIQNEPFGCSFGIIENDLIDVAAYFKLMVLYLWGMLIKYFVLLLLALL